MIKNCYSHCGKCKNFKEIKNRILTEWEGKCLKLNIKRNYYTTCCDKIELINENEFDSDEKII